jgi:hypothetical protein
MYLSSFYKQKLYCPYNNLVVNYYLK